MNVPVTLVRLWLLALPVLLLPAAVSVAAEGAEAPALEFRRVYAPANQWKDWPRDRLRYVPMKPEEFERRVQAAQAQSPELPSEAVVLTTAQYRASLDASGVLHGEALLSVHLAAKQEVLLPLAPCGLAITDARWQGAETPPELGLGADGTLRVRVKQSGELRLEWSLRGQPDADGGWRFDLAFPRCPSSELLLDLPAKLRPLALPGVTLRETPQDERSRWRIELGGHHQLPLRILEGTETEPRRRLALVREVLAYDLSLHGLDLAAELHLDIHHEPLREVVLRLDPRLKLIKAQCGEAAIPWSVLPSSDDASAVRVLLPLSEPLQGSGRILRLAAVAPLELDRRWRLPTLHAEGMFWQEGSATLGVRAPLSVKQLLPLSGRQTQTGTLSGARPGESAEIQYFAEEAGVEVVLERSRAQLQIASGTAVQLSGGEIRAQVVVELSTSEGEVFQWETDLGRHWLIDSVETQPADLLGEGWEDDGNGKLRVHLNQAVTPARPVRLVIVGRRLQSSPSQSLGLEDLTPLPFAEATGGRHLLAVRAVEPYQLQVNAAERLKQIEPGKLSAAERGLFLEPPRERVFESEGHAAGFQVALVSPKPSYMATIRTEATVVTSEATGPESRWLRESYAVHCVPDATRIDRVLIHFCKPRSAPPQWSLGAGVEGPFTARRLTAAEQASALMDTRGETWELAFRQAKGAPFEIRASRLVAWKEPAEVSLACVPEATPQQHGVLVVGASGGTTLRIENQRLEPMPLEELSPELLSTARAQFRYTPMNDAVHADQPVVLLHSATAVLPAVWIWSSHLESRYQADGTGRHLLRYCLENSGQPRLELTLAAASRLGDVAGVWTDGRPATWQIVGDSSARRLAIELPADRRYPLVSLQFQTEGGPLTAGQRLAPPLPTLEIPLLTQRWTVWLPPGYEAHAPGLFRDAGEDEGASWSRRILGPLGRPLANSPFDPATLRAWRELIAGGSSSPALQASVGRFLEGLGEGDAKSRKGVPADGRVSSKPLSWGSLLSQAREGMEIPLLVDPVALARVRLDARTPVLAASAESTAERGLALLQQAELALLVFPQGWLLTSVQEASTYQSYLVPLNSESVWSVQPSPLAEQFRQAVEGEDRGAFVPLAQWPERPLGPSDPWNLAAGPAGVEALGWTVRHVAVPADRSPELAVVCQDRVRSYQAILFLAAVGLFGWLGRQRLAWPLVGVGLAVAAASLLAEPYARLASAVALGSALALLLALVRRRRPTSAPQVPASPVLGSTVLQPDQKEPSGTAGVALLVLVLSGAILVRPTQAQEVAAEPAHTPREVHNVLIPVDEHQRPTGANYFVPEGLYQQLQRPVSASGVDSQSWLLRSALYRGTLVRQSAPEQLVLNELKASFELEVFQPSTRIELPFGREGVNLLPEGARLDGRILQPEWQEKEGTLGFDVREPGPYRLELTLRPTVQRFGNSSGIELRIPRLPMSRLELNLPTEAPTVEVPSALGAVSLQQMPPRLVAELGSSDRLALRWPEAPGSARIGPTLDVEALYWLKVHPGSVVLSTRLKLRVVEGSVRQLRLATDPRLRLLPMRDPASPVAQVQTTAGDPQIFQFELARPLSDQLVVEADFLLAGVSGIGNLRMPQIQIADARVTRRWLAVSLDRALVGEESATERLEAVAVPAFEAAWGKSETAPAMAYNLPASSSAWSLATHPDTPRVTVDQVTALSFVPGSARVQFEARLLSNGYRFQYHLAAPKQLQVERIVVRDESAEHVARWSRDAEGGITVFLSESAAGRQQLTLLGKVNTPVRGSAVLPLLRVEGTETKSSELQIFREPSVLVDLAEVPGWFALDLPLPGENEEPRRRLVKRFAVAGNSLGGSVSVNLAPNQPELVADQETRVYSDGKTWEAEASFTVKVTRGIADEFRLRVPPQWKGPYRVEPAASYRIVSEAGNRQRELVVRPRQAVDHECRFRVRGPITVRSGERLGVPAIRLLDAERGQVLLLLPTQVGTQKCSWESRGLKGVALPAELAASATAASLVAYEAETSDFQALLNPVDHAHQTANVALADLYLAWHAEGSYQGLALFDLEPAGLTHCPLHVPDEARLLSVRVEGVPATPEPQGAGLWSIPLQSSTVPQRLEILVSGRFSAPVSRGSCRFEAPSLGSLPVWQTLWSICGPAEFRAQLSGDQQPADVVQTDLIRLQGIAAVSELIQSLGLNSVEEPEKLAPWQALWRRRWDTCRQQIRQELSAERLRRSAPLAAELETLDRKYKELGTRLDYGSGAAGPSSLTSSLDPRLWPAGSSQPRATLRCLAAPGTAAMTVLLQSPPRPPHRERGLTLLGGGLLVAVATLGALRRWAGRLCCRWPATVGFLLALAWWLWLEPSLVGLLLLLLLLLVWWRPVWRRPLVPTGSPLP